MRRIKLLILLLLTWELGVAWAGTPAIMLPAPSRVLLEFWRLLSLGILWPYIWNTLCVLALGLALGLLAAFLLTALAILTPVGRDLQGLLTAMFNPLPAIALLPLALLWFGLGQRSLLFVIVHSVVWSLSLNAYTGFSTVSVTMLRVGRNLGLSGLALVREIYIPAALPGIIAGLQLAFAYAWRTIIAAELVFGVTGSKGGLGWFIYRMRYSLDTPAVFAGLLAIILLGLLVDGLFRWLQAVTVQRWGMSS